MPTPYAEIAASGAGFRSHVGITSGSAYSWLWRRRHHHHDLRHTHATIAVKAGVPVKVISERLGHESPAFTLRQYAHVIPGMQAEAAADIAGLVATS
jgi:integrase